MINIDNNNSLSPCKFYLVSSLSHFTAETNIFLEVQMVRRDYDSAS